MSSDTTRAPLAVSIRATARRPSARRTHAATHIVVLAGGQPRDVAVRSDERCVTPSSHPTSVASSRIVATSSRSRNGPTAFASSACVPRVTSRARPPRRHSASVVRSRRDVERDVRREPAQHRLTRHSLRRRDGVARVQPAHHPGEQATDADVAREIAEQPAHRRQPLVGLAELGLGARLRQQTYIPFRRSGRGARLHPGSQEPR